MTNLDDAPDLDGFFQAAAILKRSKSQLLLHQSDPITHFFYIKSGFVKVYVITDEGDVRTLLILGAKDIFPLLKSPNEPNALSIYFYEAMTDTELKALPEQDFLSQIRSSHQASWMMYLYISEFSNILADRIAVFENKNPGDKVIRLFNYLIEVCGVQLKPEVYLLQLKLTHQDIASLVGHTRETASIAINKLEKQGIISHQDGLLVINKKAIPVK